MVGASSLAQSIVLTNIILDKQNRGYGWYFLLLLFGWLGFFCGGDLLLFSFFEVHHTNTLANQELGHTP